MRSCERRPAVRWFPLLAALAIGAGRNLVDPPAWGQSPRTTASRIALEEVARQTLEPWVGGIAFAPDSRRVAFAHWGRFTVLDADSGKELFRRGPDARPVIDGAHCSFTTGIAFGAGGDVALSHADEMVRVRDGEGKNVREFEPRPLGQDFPRLWAIDRGDRIVGLGATQICVWDFHTGRRLKRYDARVLNRAMDCTAGRGTVATISAQHMISVWDPMTDRTLAEFPDPTGGKLNRIKFAPGGRRLLLWDDRNADFTLVDPDTGGTQAFQGHNRRVNDVAPFPDRPWVASASSDGTLRIWDAANGNPIAHRAFGTEIRRVAIAPDGRRLVVDADREAILLRVALVAGPARRRRGR